MTARPIVGRFAPSPTGHLHLGSLTTAVASFCHVKSMGGDWLVRIEDVDFERCKPKFATSILNDLDNLGLHSDGTIIFQSHRTDIYETYIHQLSAISYHCTCSRKDLANHAIPAVSFYDLSIKDLNLAPIYPRFCLHKQLSNNKIRLCLPDVLSAFFDGIQGVIWDNPAKSLGDVIIKRQNNMINYILACTIDDGLQGISHVMRGLDIMPMTIAQLYIARLCGLPHADYFYHLPLLMNQDGQKLSKQNLAAPIDTSTPDKASDLLFQALTLLNQNPPKDLHKNPPTVILTWGINHWDNQRLHGATLGAF